MFICSLIQSVMLGIENVAGLIWIRNNYMGICNKGYFKILNQRANIFATQPSWVKLSLSPTIHWKMQRYRIHAQVIQIKLNSKQGMAGCHLGHGELGCTCCEFRVLCCFWCLTLRTSPRSHFGCRLNLSLKAIVNGFIPSARSTYWSEVCI